MRRFFVCVSLVCSLVLGGAGCAALAQWLPTVIAALGEADQVLQSIELVASAHFEAHPDAGAEKRFRVGVAQARNALAAAHRASKGGDALNRQQIDEAWEQFRIAYQDLLALLGPLGVVAPSADGALRASPDGPLMVPAVDALQIDG